MDVEIRPEGRFANAMAKAMRERRMEIRDLAKDLGKSYEHIRKLVKGVAFPSDYFLKEICDRLGLDFAAAREMLVADRIETKWGGVPHTLGGKHPELSLMAPMWDALTTEQKDMIRFAVRNFATDNQRRILRNAS